MWIDRVVTELEAGPDVLELHPRLTVLASSDRERRRAPFDRVNAALRGERGSHLEVHTENRDPIIALRPQDGNAQLIDPDLEEPIGESELSRLGLVGQLNQAGPMVGLLRHLVVTADSLRQRTQTDAQIIHLAQTPIDRLWTVASEIQANLHTVSHTEAQGSDLNDTVRERETIEESFSDLLDEKEESVRRNKRFYLGSGVCLAVAALVAASMNPLYAIPLLLVGAGLGIAGYLSSRDKDLEERHAELAEQYGGSGFGVQLGRLDELFNTNTIYRRQREARDNLKRSLELWHELAGPADPEILIKERPRLEELAGHIRIIDNEQTIEAGPDDRQVLIGFASLLADLSRRFPAERVPLLVEDLFAEVHPELHDALKELVMRASNRRQVIIETANSDVAKWVAAEAIAGQAMLITDQPISVSPLQATEPGPADPPASADTSTPLDEAV